MNSLWFGVSKNHDLHTLRGSSNADTLALVVHGNSDVWRVEFYAESDPMIIPIPPLLRVQDPGHRNLGCSGSSNHGDAIVIFL